jgi:hypothetical protein
MSFEFLRNEGNNLGHIFINFTLVLAVRLFGLQPSGNSVTSQNTVNRTDQLHCSSSSTNFRFYCMHITFPRAPRFRQQG